MSETATSDTSSVFRRTVTSRDKLIISAALVLVALLAGFVHWFVTSSDPVQLKWAIVGSLVGFMYKSTNYRSHVKDALQWLTPSLISRQLMT